MKTKLSLAIASAILLYAPFAGAQAPAQPPTQSHAQPAAPPSAAARIISRDQAKSVVLAYLQSKGLKTDIAEFSLDDNPDEKDLPDYYLFDAYYNSRTRLSSVGAFAVDRKSAALWQRVSCEQLSSDSVLKLQDKYHQELGLVTPSEAQADSSPCY
jgi:hypothetical protein